VRTILFRAKSVFDNQWITGTYFKKDKSHFIVDENTFIAAYINPETLSGYTGLVDKYGIRIYENHVLETLLPDPVELDGFCHVRNVVAFRNGSFGIILDVTGKFKSFTSMGYKGVFNDGEVIGDILSNPNLIEGQTNGK
jgi:uncharacterized phage protein (TIGR01671 family)